MALLVLVEEIGGLAVLTRSLLGVATVLYHLVLSDVQMGFYNQRALIRLFMVHFPIKNARVEVYGILVLIQRHLSWVAVKSIHVKLGRVL